MKVKYVNDCQDEEFTLNKEYDFKIHNDKELVIIDDLGTEHSISQLSEEIRSFESHWFFKSRFKFV